MILEANNATMGWEIWWKWCRLLNEKAHQQRKAALLRPQDTTWFRHRYDDGWTLKAALAAWEPL